MLMKQIKYISQIASSIIILTGCAKTEVVAPVSVSGQEISFTTYNGREQTKATSLGSGDSFNVCAYQKVDAVESSYYASQRYLFNSVTNSFVSSPVRYWPDSGTLDFYAVSPTVCVDSGNEITADKTVSFTADGKTDFTGVLLSGQSRPAILGVLPKLTFGHKLSKVSFIAAETETNLKYVIESATLKADNVSTFSFSSAGDGSWSEPTSSDTYDLISSELTVPYNTPSGWAIGDALYLLPRQRSDSETVKLTISYSVYDQSGQTTTLKDRLVYKATKSVDLTLSAASDWGINRSIVYLLSLPTDDPDGKGIISFTVYGSKWDNDTDITIKFVSSITVPPPSVPELSLAGNVTLTATVLPADATLKTVVWSSSDTLIAVVNPSTGVVTGVAPGTVTITATSQDGSGVTGTGQVTVAPPEAVDLGLSVKWATWNMGASLPQEYGGYYAWGETETRSDYSWNTYKWGTGASVQRVSKYCTSSSFGPVDNKRVLDPEDDVAHVKWGGSWRMPTEAEWKELQDNCKSTWTTVGGVNGRLLTSIKAGYTDKSIFLPAAGYRDGSSLSYVGSDGYYWSSSLYMDNSSSAWLLYFYSVNLFPSGNSRYRGHSVRPVTD